MADFRLSDVEPTFSPVAGSPVSAGDGAEEGGDVGVALDVGLLGEVQVAAVRLALAGEGLLEVLFRL